jgi:hypothetical protein
MTTKKTHASGDRATKTTVYVEADDEITALIQKVKMAPHNVIALVLPKRAPVLQSIVNMKLLKRSADKNGKNLVLITNESSLKPIAGAVGMYVASSPTSKPVIPAGPEGLQDTDEQLLQESTVESVKGPDTIQSDFEEQVVGDSSITSADSVLETIQLDMTEDAAEDNKEKQKTKKIDKSLRVPNFSRFRKHIILGTLAVVLLTSGWLVAFVILPKATITIKTNTQSIRSTTDVTVSTSYTKLDIDKKQLPATVKQVKKTDSEKIIPSGQKDKGTKASGIMTFTNCTSQPVTIPGGTGVSSGSITFIIQTDVSLSDGNFTGGGACKVSGTHVGSATVVAQNSGDSYNLGARSYEIANVSGDVRAYGAAMSGGTSLIVKVVSQADIDAAAEKLKGKSDSVAIAELMSQISQAGLQALTSTKVVSDPVISSTVAVDQEATGDVSVVAETTYSILGVSPDLLDQLIKASIKGKINEVTQKITDNGVSTATFTIKNKVSANEFTGSLAATIVTGTQIDEAQLKEDIAGKSRGQVDALIRQYPSVSDVTIEYNPFWIMSTPKSADKITLVIEKPAVVESQ